RWPPADGMRLMFHLGTAQVEARVGRRGREAVELPDGTSSAILRLAQPVATLAGDRGVLRQPESGETVAGVTLLDTAPPRGVSRRRSSPERLAALARAIQEADGEGAGDALVAIHGAVPPARVQAVGAALRAPGSEPLPAPPLPGRLVLAPDVGAALEAQARKLVADHHAADPLSQGLPAADLRHGLLLGLRRAVTVDRSMVAAATTSVAAVIADLVARGAIAQSGDRLHDPNRGGELPGALVAAMARLEAALSVPAPPSLAEAARAAGCPPEGVRTLTESGRIVRIEADLAWSASEYQRLAALALAMATRAPLTPAAFRDATGTSRRYVLLILEDLDRRGLLRRTAPGHVPGPRAPRGDAAPAPAGSTAER
ncbi:MAG TPA: SelB C-terminal domain-containing protein, partial [Candidatus Eisenbacteria bacterium]|nr:SelB C-terminal domain-containing protein [Candidatus Eisenbacteria bacterium]